jgi:hypothetical protein
LNTIPPNLSCHLFVDRQVHYVDLEPAVRQGVYIALADTHECTLLTAERTTTPWVLKLGKLL